jgi:hypothetical protein
VSAPAGEIEHSTKFGAIWACASALCNHAARTIGMERIRTARMAISLEVKMHAQR